MKDQFEKIRQRTIQYSYIDGTNELTFAGLCIILALFFLAQVLVPAGSLLYKLLNASLVLVVIGGVFLVRRLSQVIKSRLTYPRTGYVAYPKKPASRLGSILFTVGMLALVAFMFTQAPASLAWMPAVTGFIIAFVLLVIGYSTRLGRFYMIGLVTLLIGGGLSWVGIGDILGLSVFYGLLGLVMGLSGGCTLRTYLNSAPAPGETNDAK